MNRWIALICAGVIVPAQAFAGPAKTATGTWTVDGSVQDTPVKMTCVLTEADHKLTGNCTGAAGDSVARTITGETTEKGLDWQFKTTYDGNPITVTMAGALSAEGDKISGTISVDPMAVDGTFTATRVNDAPAAPVSNDN